MAYDLIGCMELSGGKYRPKWSGPCFGSDLIGCMELSGGKYRPRLNSGFGLCLDDKTGCMELSGGKYRPVLTYDEYADEAELLAACCPDCNECAVCFDVCLDRFFIQVTFEGIETCAGVVKGPTVNTTFMLPYTGSSGFCEWEYIGGSYLVQVRQQDIIPGGGIRYQVNYFIGSAQFQLFLPESDAFPSCDDVGETNVFTNSWDSCVGTTRGKNGTATITWDP